MMYQAGKEWNKKKGGNDTWIPIIGYFEKYITNFNQTDISSWEEHDRDRQAAINNAMCKKCVGDVKVHDGLDLVNRIVLDKLNIDRTIVDVIFNQVTYMTQADYEHKLSEIQKTEGIDDLTIEKCRQCIYNNSVSRDVRTKIKNWFTHSNYDQLIHEHENYKKREESYRSYDNLRHEEYRNHFGDEQYNAFQTEWDVIGPQESVYYDSYRDMEQLSENEQEHVRDYERRGFGQNYTNCDGKFKRECGEPCKWIKGNRKEGIAGTCVN